MSRRSMIRAEARRTERRRRRLARRATLSVAAALGAGGALTASADAATFPVLNKNDTGADSLRQAVIAANASPDADVITFGPAVTGSMAVNSEIAITNPVDIQGPGAGQLKLVSSGGHRLFNVNAIPAPDQAVRIAGLTLTDGNAMVGGAISNFPAANNAAELTVQNCVITGNSASNGGGAIYSRAGSLTIDGSTITDNSGTHGGGVLISRTDGDQSTEFTITNSTISGNEATTGKGGAIYMDRLLGGTLIRSTTISGNTSHDDGAGIDTYRGTGASLTIDSSAIVNNAGHYSGGGLSVFEPSGPLLISNSTFSGNSAREGGGLDLTIGTNLPMTVTNSTISGNDASERGGGIFFYADDASAKLSLNSTIVAGNLAPAGPDLIQRSATFGTLEAGFSLFGTDPRAGIKLVESAPGTNLFAADPELGGLSSNGGPTRTMLPGAAGPAIDAGSAAGLSVDARGLPRTVDQPATNASDGTDIGAVERADTELTGAAATAAAEQRQHGKKISVTVSVEAGESATAASAGAVTVGKSTFPLTGDAVAVVKDQPQTVVLSPESKSAAKKIAKALGKGKKLHAAVSVAFTDASANSDTEQVEVELTGKKKKKHHKHGG